MRTDRTEKNNTPQVECDLAPTAVPPVSMPSVPEKPGELACRRGRRPPRSRGELSELPGSRGEFLAVLDRSGPCLPIKKSIKISNIYYSTLAQSYNNKHVMC